MAATQKSPSRSTHHPRSRRTQIAKAAYSKAHRLSAAPVTSDLTDPTMAHIRHSPTIPTTAGLEISMRDYIIAAAAGFNSHCRVVGKTAAGEYLLEIPLSKELEQLQGIAKMITAFERRNSLRSQAKAKS